MCQSKAEGGQRCSAHTSAALTSAEAAYRSVAGEAEALRANGQPVPAEMVEACLRAEYRREDALAAHASTAVGRADLEARLASLRTQRGHAARSEEMTLTMALTEGRALHARSATIAQSVAQGLMTAGEAELEATHPAPEWAAHREKSIRAALRRHERSSRPDTVRVNPRVGSRPLSTPADPVAALEQVRASAGPAGQARIAEMEGYYARYDARTRQALTPGGRALLEARLADLPDVPSGYHRVRVYDANASAAQREAEEIREVLDDLWMVKNLAPEQVPSASVRNHRAAQIAAAARREDAAA